MKRLAFLLGISAIACLGSPSEPQLTGPGRRVLFIGNSHTYVNDVPGLLQALAAAGGESLAVASTTAANLALIDHWNGGSARADIARGGWEIVVLQQGWTPAGPCRDTLRLAARSFAGDAAKVGAKIAMYQVWTQASRPAQMPGTIRSYELAAEDVSGLLFPAAAAFRAALARDPSLQLYGDDTHASPAGSYLAALVMYATVFKRSPVGLPASVQTLGGVRITLPLTTATVLQEAAADVTIRGLGGSNGVDGPLIANPGSC
ncbi:MAG: hypothetical protein ABIY52_11225 [Gemmatimonadaceae bacterium]